MLGHCYMSVCLAVNQNLEENSGMVGSGYNNYLKISLSVESVSVYIALSECTLGSASSGKVVSKLGVTITSSKHGREGGSLVFEANEDNKVIRGFLQ